MAATSPRLPSLGRGAGYIRRNESGLAPALGAPLLALYAATAVAVGTIATLRRDVP